MMEGSDNAGENDVLLHNNGRSMNQSAPTPEQRVAERTSFPCYGHGFERIISLYIHYLTVPLLNSLLVKRAIQYWLDKSTIHITPRWIGFTVLLALFFLRVYLLQGYFIVAYGLGIFLLNNFIAFLSPLEDPSSLHDTDGPSLPMSAKEGKEFRPFTRRLPEFKFWLASTRGVLWSIGMTFFSMFDVPVFWPILLIYFFVLFFMTMKRQIMHMYQHKYVPISWGKVKSKNAGVERGMYGGGMSRSR